MKVVDGQKGDRSDQLLEGSKSIFLVRYPLPCPYQDSLSLVLCLLVTASARLDITLV